MIKRSIALAFVALGAEASAQTRAFTGATLIDGAPRPAITNATIVVNNGRIVAAGPADAIPVPDGSERISKSASTVLAKFGHIDNIPSDWREWKANVKGAASLSATLEENRELAMLFRVLATLREDIELFGDVDELEYRGPTPAFDVIKSWLGA